LSSVLRLIGLRIAVLSMKLIFLFYFLVFIQIVTAITGGIRYKYLPLPLKILEGLILVSVVEVFVQWILGTHHIHNAWTSHVYTLIEIVCISVIYFVWLKNDTYRFMLLVCLSSFIVFWVVSKFTFEPFSMLDGWSASVSKIIQITFSVFILVEVIKENDIVWTDDPRFWVVASVIIYSAGILFWFALFNKMLSISPDRLRQVTSMNWILTSISYLLFARSFLCKR